MVSTTLFPEAPAKAPNIEQQNIRLFTRTTITNVDLSLVAYATPTPPPEISSHGTAKVR
jgi:hypothetical protein